MLTVLHCGLWHLESYVETIYPPYLMFRIFKWTGSGCFLWLLILSITQSFSTRSDLFPYRLRTNSGDTLVHLLFMIFKQNVQY